VDIRYLYSRENQCDKVGMELDSSSLVMIFSAVFAVGGAFILVLILLLVVKRPYPSRESSGAITLTLASVILLSAMWCMWLSPTVETRKYDEIASSSLSVEPLGLVTQDFTAQKGQEIEVSINSVLVGRVEPPEFPTFSVKIKDPKGSLIWAQTNVTTVSFTRQVTESGVFKVEISNPKRETLSLSMRVLDRTKMTFRRLEPAGQWLILMSLPILGLGIWFIHFRKQNQQTSIDRIRENEALGEHQAYV